MVVAVAIAMVVVVAGVPVEVESPLGPPELAWAPVITGDVIARGSTEVAVVIVAVLPDSVAVAMTVFGSVKIAVATVGAPTPTNPSPVVMMNVVAAHRANVFTATTTTRNSVLQLCGWVQPAGNASQKPECLTELVPPGGYRVVRYE